jgi:hypothetical protein
MASELEFPRLVQVGDKLYPELAFINAMTSAGLRHITESIPQGATVRKAMKVVRASKSRETLKLVRKAALRALLEHGTRVPATLGANVVAVFPAPD